MNHARIHARAVLRPEVVTAHLEELIRAKWPDGVVFLESPGPTQWLVRSAEVEYLGISIWIRSPKVLEMRRGIGDICSWVQTYLQEGLAARLGARCSNQGVSDRWDPDTSVGATFEAWYYMSMGAEPGQDPQIDDIWRRIIDKKEGLVDSARRIVFNADGTLR